MRGTKALGSLKGLLPPIHPPLPLNRRESQHLFTALTTSFRTHLDQEHGFLEEQDTITGTPPSTLPDPAWPRVGRRPTDSHVRSILSNPLFAYDRTIHQTAMRPSGARDPMDVFDEAVAKGMMTQKRAAGVLTAKRRAILQSSSISIKEETATSRTALRVIQWLRAAGHERDLSFIAFTALTNPLLKFMVEEGLEEIAWGWLDRLMRGEGPQNPSSKTQVTPAGYVLSVLTAARANRDDTLNQAYACMLRADDMFKQSPKFEDNAIYPWRELSRWSTDTAWKRSAPSGALFDSFVRMSKHLCAPSLIIDRAHLALHHPTNPSAEEALKQLESESLWVEIEAEGKKWNPFTRRVVYMGVDAVQYLVRHGEKGQAESLMEFLTTRLRDVLGAEYDDKRFPMGSLRAC